ncbi:MlaE family ABC transporter permease [Humisphaera borealis]|uniref:ABC transporter permease n=1 Tax=Humisphaera borealis TaxID=2807512 RepID=A0A7M2X0S7_9BACT|nr:ABC transporter permease [Humisphaera borealis]QOV91346.1 ABC transporter permease [Humisphaera borealis]
MPINRVEALGNHTLSVIANLLAAFGRFCDFAGRTFGGVLRSGFRWKGLRLLVPQMFEVGVRSVPVVGITGAFIGMVMAIESYNSFKQLGQESRLGSVINLSVVKQIGPVLAAMMLAGRVGGALTAELGTMNVTEQLDAMRVMGSDPIRYLVVPRFLACVLLTPILTIYSDLLGVVGGYFISVSYLGIASGPYWQYSAQAIENWQIFEGIFKSIFFGAAIGLVSCYKGFNSGAGASGVGKACTESFVASFISIIVLNFFFARLLSGLYFGLYGNRGGVFS